MTTFGRIIAIILIGAAASGGWAILGSVTSSRTHKASSNLEGDVGSLWGQPQRQTAAEVKFKWYERRLVSRQEEEKGHKRTISHWETDVKEKEVDLESTRVNATFRLDQRLKGLIWYPLYGVEFDAEWSYHHQEEQSGSVVLSYKFPDQQALYDDFRFVVDGQDLAQGLKPSQGFVRHEVSVKRGQKVVLAVHYKARGMRQWEYAPTTGGVASLHDFQVKLICDFDSIDFPSGSLSPSSKTHHSQGGWTLSWDFAQVITGHSIGLVMPERVQPGELAQDLSATAPISLALFFLVIFALSVLRKLDIHPINYLAIAGAFFSFQLLFAYTVDHLTIGVAFAIASLASIIMVTTYLRLVVSARFAFREAALAQLVYQVGFAAAHFLKGYTGLTVAVLVTLTLFLLMMLTGRVSWSTALMKKRAS